MILNLIIKEVISCLQRKINSKGAEILISQLPSCEADKQQITQLFTQIVDNALKFCSPDRKCVIKISAMVSDTYSIYCVEDNGKGIPEQLLDKIFEPFYQIDPNAGGEGIGLTIVRNIITAHDGTISVESKVNEGSRFFITLLAGR